MAVLVPSVFLTFVCNELRRFVLSALCNRLTAEISYTQQMRLIGRRLAELDEEWDTERCLETMAPTITLIGITLGLAVNRKWFALPLLVQAFFLQHALQGWCPPLPVLRRLGVRTAAEIDEERYALKAVRGDFQEIYKRGNGSKDVMNAIRK